MYCPQSGVFKYRNMFDAFASIWRNEGGRGMSEKFTPKKVNLEGTFYQGSAQRMNKYDLVLFYISRMNFSVVSYAQNYL